jgi:hypothetical protein
MNSICEVVSQCSLTWAALLRMLDPLSNLLHLDTDRVTCSLGSWPILAAKEARVFPRIKTSSSRLLNTLFHNNLLVRSNRVLLRRSPPARFRATNRMQA